MIKTIPLFSLSLLSLAIANSVAAQEVTSLPTMNVDGKAIVVQEEHRLTDSVPVVTIKQEVFKKQAGAQLINDVIKHMPGVFTGGAPGENKDVRLRGLDKEFSRVEFNGVQLPGSGEKREMNINRIPTSLVEQVTIIRNNTAEHEADGLAGRVHIKMREIPLEEQLEVSVAGAGVDGLDLDGKQAAVTYGNRFDEHWGLQGTLSFIDNPFSKEKLKLTPDGSVKEQESEDKSIDNITAIWDLGYFYGDDENELHIKPMLIRDDEDKSKLKSKFDNDGVTIKEYEDEIENSVKETLGLTLENKHHINAKTQVSSSVGYYRTTENKVKNKAKLDSNMVANPAKAERELEDKQDAFWQAKTELTHNWSSAFDNELKIGATVRLRERHRNKDKYKNNVLTAGDAKDDYRLKEDYYAAFIQNKMQISDAFSLQPGIRFEKVELNTSDSTGNQGANSQTDLLPSLSANYRLNNKIAFHGAASKTLNRPKFDELSPYESEKDGKIVRGNPQLKTSRANAYDLGLDYVSDEIFVGVNYFYRDISDLIEQRLTGEVVDGKDVYQVQNVGDGSLSGIEFEQRVSFSSFNSSLLKSLTITANQSFIDSEIENSDGTTTSFKDQPDFIANLIVDWTLPSTATNFSVAYNYVAEIKMNDYHDGRASEQYLDIKITQPLSQQWSAYITATNLTDEERVKFKNNGEIEHESGERTFWVGVTGNF
jgi:outer membrane receptor protein involved in Fe transport